MTNCLISYNLFTEWIGLNTFLIHTNESNQQKAKKKHTGTDLCHHGNWCRLCISLKTVFEQIYKMCFITVIITMHIPCEKHLGFLII